MMVEASRVCYPLYHYTQTGALTRISSKLIIATAPSSLPLAQHNHMALVYTNYELITTREVIAQVASRRKCSKKRLPK
jgi:hypothetical protein